MTYEEMIQGVLGSLERIKTEVDHSPRPGENGASRQYVAAIHDYLADIPTFDEWWDRPGAAPYLEPRCQEAEAR